MKRWFAEVMRGVGATHGAMWLADRVTVDPALGWRPVAVDRESRFIILTYHRVNDHKSPFMIDTVSPQRFDEQMRYLARHFNVMPLTTIVERLKDKAPLPRRCVAVTFDDGYEDNHRFAMPILRRYGLPATVFVTAGCLERNEALWFDKVLTAFENTRRNRLEMSDIGLTFSFASIDQKVQAAFQTLRTLIGLAGQDRLAAVDAICEQLRVADDGPICGSMLSWAQVREMARNEIEIGSHTLTHPILSRIASEQVKEEIWGSKHLIEEHTQAKTRLFAYPNGKPSDLTPDVMGEVSSAGYEAAVTTSLKGNTACSGLFELGRLALASRTLAEFAVSLARGYLTASCSE